MCINFVYLFLVVLSVCVRVLLPSDDEINVYSICKGIFSYFLKISETRLFRTESLNAS